MDDIVEALSARYGGLVPAQDLREWGVNSHAARRLVERGALVSVRRGVYAAGALWHGGVEHAGARHRLLVRAAAHCAQRPIVVSHLSAAALHGLPMIGRWPSVTHIIDTDAAGGSSSRLIISHRGGPAPDTVQIEGVSATSLARTLVDVASTSSFLVAVTMIDHALRAEAERVQNEARRGLAGLPPLTAADLLDELGVVQPRTGARQAERAIMFANPLAANPGESMSRVRMHELGFEVPELQVCFPNVDGHDYWVDYFWRRIGKIGEFDGKHKYTRGAILGDRDPAAVVVAEKLREDALRRRVNSFTRWDWDMAISPRRFYEFLMSEGVPRA